MTVVPAEDSDLPLYIELDGSGTQGNKGIRLQGEASDGMLTATLTADYSSDLTDFTIDIDSRQWASKLVNRLPHFARLQQIVECLAVPTQARDLYTHGELESEFGAGRLDGSELFRPRRALFDEIAARD
jgi:hypothetical protein